MTSAENRWAWRRLFTALGAALKRGILGKSSREYMKQFNGGDESQDRPIAALLGWPQEQTRKPDSSHLRGSGDTAVPVQAIVGSRFSPEPDANLVADGPSVNGGTTRADSASQTATRS
jgi:hypothetical protein